MGAVKSCCHKQKDDKLMVTKMDLRHCGCLEVPHIVFNAERCIETLILASNQITSLPPQLFHCLEMKHLNLNDNCLNSIPSAIGSFLHLVSLKLDKNNLQDLPDNLKMCKKLKRLSLNNNPWKQMPNIVTQLINLEELYMNDCELNYLPASVGRLCKLKIIEIRNNNLCNLPLSMTRLELLTRLDISDNEFNEFPTCIPKLKNLTELLLDNNDIEEIIDIKNLVCLEHLDASYNHISNVSETIGCCTNLNMLNLSFNYIEQLPNSIGNITCLQTLQLEMNELTEIPKSIGKLSHLEELNLCNNKLYSLPNTIGLLRNLRNLNVSRNIIQEFPPEIGSCTKLAIINAAYNRLQVLPSEIGYLNNLKVLDLVGNFLMYLPITIANLSGIRAIWLSANQNVPLIPFTEDLNIASGERFLTNIALPQLGEIPLRNGDSTVNKALNNDKSASWNKKIRFAEDEDIQPGRLHRTPTPFPKELRSPSKKHQRNEEPKPNGNYVNVIDGKISEQETPLLQPPVTTTGPGLLDFSEGGGTRIREANIRRNNKEVNFEAATQNYNGNGAINIESEYDRVLESEIKRSRPDSDQSGSKVLNQERVDLLPTETPSQVPYTKNESNYESDLTRLYGNTSSALPGYRTIETEAKNNSENTFEPGINSRHTMDAGGNMQENFENIYRQQVIYSNVVNKSQVRDNPHNGNFENENSKIDSQKIREMYQNDVIYSSSKVPRFVSKECGSPSANDYYNVNTENQLKYLCSSSILYRENNFIRTPSINSIQGDSKITYSIPPPLSPPSSNGNFSGVDVPSRNVNVSSGFERPSSKQDLISLAEQMKNRNISPPCYEIAKMYSTKAALFESNRVDQLKSN